MNPPLSVGITSEIGRLKGVIVHTPGPEVENMTPESAQRALYSDLLNLSVVTEEYARFEATLEQMTQVFKVRDLLGDILEQEPVRSDLLSEICVREGAEEILDRLAVMTPEAVAGALVEGVVMEKDNLTKYLDRERYALQPLHNFFFMRDPAAVIFDQVMISRMANQVRERESLIMEAIFTHHPSIDARLFQTHAHRKESAKAFIEGGDVLVAREDILIIGQGGRTSTQGIDEMIEHLKTKDGIWHIIVQELPYAPESFIHLDMVFTLLDVDACMVYKPLILDSNRFLTLHIRIDHGKVFIGEERNVPSALGKLGMPLQVICCGGEKDIYSQEREQWHSGANFFCLAPGKVMGYGRNVFTLEELNRHGYDIIPAAALEYEALDLAADDKVVITIEGTELARGGGGCRCMTLPLARSEVGWP